MDLTLRRFLYLSFFAIFFIVGAALLFHLQGYRYNQDKGRIEQTGAIVVESIPKGALVTVNDKEQSRLTPAAIQSLAAGDYNVSVHLDGYQDWRKVLGVRSSRVTFSGQLRLWPPPQLGERMLGTSGAESLLSPNGQHLLYRLRSGLASGLWLMNLATGKTALITRPSSGTASALAWSPSSRRILSFQLNSGSARIDLYDLEEDLWETVPLPNEVKPQLVRWGENDQLLYVATTEELYQWNRRTKALKLVWRERLDDFRVHDELVWGLVRSNSGGLGLKVLNRTNLKLIPLEEPPQLAGSASFFEARGEWLPLLDQDRHTLYLLHSPLTELAPVRKLPEVISVDWAPDGDRLLLTNNIEIWEYRIDDDKLTLRERVSEPITKSRFFGEEAYLIAAVGNKVWALELDERGERQRWLLAEYTTPIEDIFLDPKVRTLTVETADGFYRLTLRHESDGVLPKVRL